MDNQLSWSAEPYKNDNKMSLIALLFFMMGALNLYVALRRKRSWLSSEAQRLLKLVLFSVFLAGAIELATLS
jgi:hypothetical protein